MLKLKIAISVFLLMALPISIFAQSKTDTTVTIKDGVKTTTITSQVPVDSEAASDTTGQYAAYMASIDTTSLGSNLNLQAVAELFRTSKDLEAFEKRLNDKDEGVNNLDLNEDGKTDYLRVVDHAEKNTHVIVIQAVVGKDQFQDVASIDVVQDGDKVSLQIVGDKDIYGTDYYIEPEKEEEVKDYPTVKVIFVVGYSPYYSPYYWGYYPPYYHPWHPYPAHYYHHHVYHHHYYHHHHYGGYHHGHGHVNPHARSVYNRNRVTAPINKTQRYNNNTPQRPVNKTRPSTRPSTRPTAPSSRPSQPKTRPAQKPNAGHQAKPSHNPTRPSTRPASPSTRPSQPKTRPAQPKHSQSQARPAQPRTQQRARPAARPARRPGRR